jgi:signal transduction histidine kinase/ActR/RegA family two-component response regulator
LNGKFFRILAEKQKVNGVTLRTRLFLLAAAAILPLIAMAGIALFTLFEQQREQVARAGLEVTRALATAMDGEFARSIASLEVLATSSRMDSGEMEALYQRAQRAVASQPDWQLLNLFDPSGRQLMSTGFPFGAALPDVIERESFEAVARTLRPAVGYLVKGPDGTWGVPVRVPVVRNGELRYVLSAVIKPEGLLEVLLRQRISPDWVAAVVDLKGLRVARSRLHAESVGTTAPPEFLEMMRRGEPEWSGMVTAAEGQRVFTAVSRSPRTGWLVAIGIPPELVEAGARRTLHVIGGGIALSVLLGALAALVVARSVSRPMSGLREAARAVGEGRPPRPPATSIREIQDVGNTLVASSELAARLLQREQAARAVAEAANRSKDEFLAMLGHELRNPLAAISNAASLLERAGDADTAARASRIVARQAGHLSRLTDDLLDASRALTGKIVLRPQPLDLAAVAAQSLATLGAAGRTAAHTVMPDLRSAWVNADPIRLDQVIGNLVVNAVKYTPAGGTIRVSVAPEGEAAVLRVADNGIGLTPELAGRVFDLFVQGERELDRSEGGLGIGLTLVRRLAEMHGGSASVHSAGRGTGSEFTVRLPLTEARPAAAPAPAAPAVASRLVLVVEDNDDARETLASLLELAGHRVETASDGLQGLEKALAIQPEVALLDVGLPRIDGYELARRIRACGSIRRPFLVALTGYGLPEDRQRALDAGFDAHVVKPVDPVVLAQLISSPTSALSEPARP